MNTAQLEPASVAAPKNTSAKSLPKSQSLANWGLKDVIHDVRTSAFCGPTAVAAITGQPISAVRDAYRFVRFEHRWIGFPRRPPIMGTTSEELASVLRLFGFDGHWEYHTDKPTLAAYLKARQGYCRTHPTAVFFGRHVVAIKGWEFCDTFTDGQVVEADDAPHRRKRVRAVFVITEQIAPKTFPRKWIL